MSISQPPISLLFAAVVSTLTAVATVANAQVPDSLTEEQAAEMSAAEVIEIWAERLDKPFERDTVVRLTGEQLAQQGATDLGSALALLPDVAVREVGRGGSNLDIRGARKGAVRVLIDGVSVSDPYYGTFDVSTIPVTDIVQIRVSTTPSSPIDGIGGPGGVVEVHTRDAVGAQLVQARLTGGTLRTGQVTGTARAMLSAPAAHSSGWGIRLSASGLVGAREFSLPPQALVATIDEGRRASTFAVRLERRGQPASNRNQISSRDVVDVFVDDRRYLSSPSETKVGSLLLIDRETSSRASIGVDRQRGKWQGLGRAWAHGLLRRSRSFRDVALSDQSQAEDLRSYRLGGSMLTTRPLGSQSRITASVNVDHERAKVSTSQISNIGDTTTLAAATQFATQTKATNIDGAIGLAVPFGIDASPWLEGKLVGRWQPRRMLDVSATLARKGRPPSLRDRFDSSIGNQSLGPEIANLAELRALIETAAVRIELAGYARRSTGSTRVSIDTGKLQNLGTLNVVGGDMMASVLLIDSDWKLRVAGAYNYVRARSNSSGDADALDRLPAHRGEGSVQLSANAGWSLRGRGRGYTKSQDQGQSVSGAFLVDLSASFVKRSWLVAANLEDALDRRPAIRTGYFAPGRAASLSLTKTW